LPGKRCYVFNTSSIFKFSGIAQPADNRNHIDGFRTREEIDQASKKQPAEAAEELKAKAKEKAEPRTAPKKKADKPKEAEADEAAAIKSQGVGVERAHQAIACLKRIPKGDALRRRAFEIVFDYIKQNR
jgi:hypothetical protein